MREWMLRKHENPEDPSTALDVFEADPQKWSPHCFPELARLCVVTRPGFGAEEMVQFLFTVLAAQKDLVMANAPRPTTTFVQMRSATAAATVLKRAVTDPSQFWNAGFSSICLALTREQQRHEVDDRRVNFFPAPDEDEVVVVPPAPEAPPPRAWGEAPRGWPAVADEKPSPPATAWGAPTPVDGLVAEIQAQATIEIRGGNRVTLAEYLEATVKTARLRKWILLNREQATQFTVNQATWHTRVQRFARACNSQHEMTPGDLHEIKATLTCDEMATLFDPEHTDMLRALFASTTTSYKLF